MSGLDPLGRRDVRALILRLRDRGCTVFFSSHVLSDAEALCSRVAILAKGRLRTAGSLTDLLQFQARGWELVVANVAPPLLATLSAGALRVADLGGQRYTFDLPVEPSPDEWLSEVAKSGASLVSLNPVRDTLEDLFVQQVSNADVVNRDRGLGAAVATGKPR